MFVVCSCVHMCVQVAKDVATRQLLDKRIQTEMMLRLQYEERIKQAQVSSMCGTDPHTHMHVHCCNNLVSLHAIVPASACIRVCRHKCGYVCVLCVCAYRPKQQQPTPRSKKRSVPPSPPHPFPTPPRRSPRHPRLPPPRRPLSSHRSLCQTTQPTNLPSLSQTQQAQRRLHQYHLCPGSQRTQRWVWSATRRGYRGSSRHSHPARWRRRRSQRARGLWDRRVSTRVRMTLESRPRVAIGCLACGLRAMGRRLRHARQICSTGHNSHRQSHNVSPHRNLTWGRLS